MTILAVDPGLCDLGWAVVEPRTGRVLDLGVVHQERNDKLAKSTCRAQRLHRQAVALHRAATTHRCSVLAAEAMSFNPRRFTMALGLGMSWGGITALGVALGLELYELPPKQWQHAVTGVAKGKVDYDDVARRLADYLHGNAAIALAGVKPALRTHALDAVGVGVFTALRPEQATRIGGPT